MATSLGLTLLLPIVSWASSLDVLAAAAQSGTRGLRVTVGSSCTVDDQTATGQTLSGPVTLEACQSVTSSSTTVTSGQVTFRAGDRIVLGDGFVVQSGATFVAEVDRSLQRDAYLEDLTPQTEPHYAAGFYVRFDSLSIGASDRFDLFTAESSNTARWINLLVKKNGSENRLIVEARQNGGSILTTEGTSEIHVPSGWHWLSLDWKIASGSANDGWVRLYLDGTFYAELTGIANSNGQVDAARLGAVGVDPATSGSFDIDRFVSRIAGPIAPPQ